MKAGMLIFGLLLTPLSVFASPQSPKPRPKTAIVKPCAEIKDYLKWERVNAKPFYVESQLAWLRRGATPKELHDEAKNNPHVYTYITVYVNGIGKQAMNAAESVGFPEGSVIVKEKYETVKSSLKIKPDSPPKLMTVMVKRKKGYAPKTGDWEYLVTKGSGELQERGKIERCQNCHAKRKKTDYVFRTYREETLR